MSKAVGAPVRVQFMRWDEHGWDQYGPAGAARPPRRHRWSGNVVAYDYISYEPPNVDLETSAQLIGIPLDTLGTGEGRREQQRGDVRVPNRRVTSSRCLF